MLFSVLAFSEVWPEGPKIIFKRLADQKNCPPLQYTKLPIPEEHFYQCTSHAAEKPTYCRLFAFSLFSLKKTSNLNYDAKSSLHAELLEKKTNLKNAFFVSEIFFCQELNLPIKFCSRKIKNF
jgi:hypothetical protein